MSDITLSAGVRQNLLSLQNTADLMASTQNRLATGKKVNSALDNPTNFFTASSLQARSNDMSQLMDSMSNGIKTLEAADNGLSAITKSLESMQSTLRQARQDKSFDTASYTVDLGSTPAGTETLSISGGSVGDTAVDVALATAGTAVQSTVTASADYVVPTAATAASTDITFGTALTFDNNGDQLNFSVALDGGGTASITIDDTIVGAVGNTDTVIDDIDELQAAMAAAIDAEGTYTEGVDYELSNDGTDITLSSLGTGTTSDVVISSTGVVDGGGGDTLTNTSGIADVDATNGSAAVDRVITVGDGTTTSNITLTSANGADAAAARVTIQAQLDADGIDATVGGTGDRIDIVGATDGSNTITTGGAEADDVSCGCAV